MADRAASGLSDAAADWFIVTIGIRRGRRGRRMCNRKPERRRCRMAIDWEDVWAVDTEETSRT
jgi:hypothetical protein